MARPSLEEIGKEGFDLIDQFYAKNKYHQQPCTYRKPENPVIIEKPPVYSSQNIYHPSRDQLIAFRTVNPSSIRRVYVHQYSDPIPNLYPRTQDYYVGDDDNNDKGRDHAGAVPSEDTVGGEPVTGKTKYSGKWKKYGMWG